MPWVVEERRTDRGTCHTLIEVLHTFPDDLHESREGECQLQIGVAALSEEACVAWMLLD